ncbi:vomeronasal 2 receptor, 5 isoform X2 [Rattus norvegicus]|uniref:vomeronasal 2 receptor, 5 isoform X2 n=1 Tax=Rattus norvegicus TaxID=10116 RepID=UPI0008102546|nr:vomeronasal 2 receptor, 5 isoform X1 [Rattus norvegicus]|eukprot:XP_017445187.1 PREDICTED: vomeronasal 2 receptor, 5 isoform X2 [Rattus norvegicus]
MKKLCAFTIAIFSLKFCLILCSLTEPNCFWRIKSSEDNDGDLRSDCGFVLFTHEGPIPEDFYNDIINFRIPARKYEFFLVLLFATDEINKNPYLLPNMSLIFNIIFGLCEDTLGVLDKAYLHQNSNSELFNYYCGINQLCDVDLTGPSWTTSLKLSIYSRTPKIFFGSFNPNLSDHDQFPYIYQIAAKDTYLFHGMVSLMFHFGWTWIGLVISDDDQGIQFLSDLREEMQRHAICLAFVNMIPETMQIYKTRVKIYDQQLMTSSAKVVIIYGEVNSTLELSFRRWAYLGAQRIWITTSQWDVITHKKDFSLDFSHGTVTFAHHHNDIAVFRNFMQTINTSMYPVDISQSMLQWNHFNCSISKNKKKMDCFTFKNPLEWLIQHTFDMVLSEEGYNLYNAVYAVAHTYHKLIFQQVESQKMEEPKGLFTDCQQVTSLLKTIEFTNPVGELVDTKHKENQCATYDIFITWNFPQGLGLKVKIGSYFPCLPQSQQLHISEDWEWVTGGVLPQIPPSVCSMTCTAGFRKIHQKETADCCFDCVQCQENEIANDTDMEQCVKCPDDSYANLEQSQCLQRVVTFLAYEDPLGMALGCMALSFSAITILVLVTFVKYKDTPIVKANNRILSYILLISLVFCFLCSLLYIGHPNQATCILQQTTFAIFFTVAISTVLAKTITVVTAFKLTTPERRIKKIMIKGAINLLIPICTLIQLVLCAVWLVISPPFIDRDIQSEHGKVIIICNKGSVIAFHFVLGYLGSLALGSFTVAFLARNLPDRFNEAKFLTFSMLVFYSVWITFLPVYHSTRGKDMVIVEVFSILASSAGLLGCIFFQKCYVLLVRPDLNVLRK